MDARELLDLGQGVLLHERAEDLGELAAELFVDVFANGTVLDVEPKRACVSLAMQLRRLSIDPSWIERRAVNSTELTVRATFTIARPGDRAPPE